MMMPAPPPNTLDRALATLEWTLLGAHRERISTSAPLSQLHDGPGFFYVSRGTVRMLGLDGPGHAGVSDVAGASGTPGLAADAAARTLDPPGASAPELVAGDLVFFPRGHSVAAVTTADAEIVDVGFEQPRQRLPVADGLPDSLVVRDFAGQEPTMVALIEGMGCGGRAGLAGKRPGDAVICSRIATTIVSAAVRSWNEAGCAPDGWLRRVDDPHLSVALDAMHSRPEAAWTLDELARLAMMSRSAFAERFRDLASETPLAYLTRLRMEKAEAMLLRAELSVDEIANALGYESQAGFRRAFRRHTGSTPGRWRAEA